MSDWVVIPCDFCRRQTVTNHPDSMVICETCLTKWNEEDEKLGLLDDDDDEIEFDCA